MNRLLFLVTLLFAVHVTYGQHNGYGYGYLYIKKGAKKKRTFVEGDRIMLQLDDDEVVIAPITLLRNDTIFLSGRPYPVSRVKAVLLPRKKNKFPVDAKTLALITAGAAMTTYGLTLNGHATFKRALTAGLSIGYGPILAKYLGKGFLLAISRKKFRMGKKYRLQVIDFYLPPKRAF